MVQAPARFGPPTRPTSGSRARSRATGALCSTAYFFCSSYSSAGASAGRASAAPEGTSPSPARQVKKSAWAGLRCHRCRPASASCRQCAAEGYCACITRVLASQRSCNCAATRASQAVWAVCCSARRPGKMADKKPASPAGAASGVMGAVASGARLRGARWQTVWGRAAPSGTAGCSPGVSTPGATVRPGVRRTASPPFKITSERPQISTSSPKASAADPRTRRPLTKTPLRLRS